jgi:hypothetical protein
MNGLGFLTEDENDQNIRPYLTEEDSTHVKIEGGKLVQILWASFET